MPRGRSDIHTVARFADSFSARELWYKLSMTRTIFGGIPYAASMRHRLSISVYAVESLLKIHEVVVKSISGIQCTFRQSRAQ